jgi:hypothetical protein
MDARISFNEILNALRLLVYACPQAPSRMELCNRAPYAAAKMRLDVLANGTRIEVECRQAFNQLIYCARGKAGNTILDHLGDGAAT